MSRERSDWLLSEIATGLQYLVAIGLPGCPSDEIIGHTAEIWAAALRPERAWRQARDTPRLEEAFRKLVVQSNEWPAPAALLRAMPALEPVLALRPPGDPAKARAKIRELLNEIEQDETARAEEGRPAVTMNDDVHRAVTALYEELRRG